MSGSFSCGHRVGLSIMIIAYLTLRAFLSIITSRVRGNKMICRKYTAYTSQFEISLYRRQSLNLFSF